MSQPLQLSAEPMRAWVNDGHGGRVRPVMCVVVESDSGLCLAMDLAESREFAFDTAGRVLSSLLKTGRTSPNVRVQVRDAELATALGHRIELANVKFEVVDRLDAVDVLMRHMERDIFPNRAGSPVKAGGASIDRLRAFADGSVAFYAAAPWRHLHDDDVVGVESPPPPKGLGFASILGAGGQVFGLGFYGDAKGYDRLRNSVDPHKYTARNPRWSLLFHAPDELPPEDAELWDEHGLRVASDESVPVLLRYRGATKVDRPDEKTLTFVEGLCRALAATTEEELDSGRWEKTVRRFDGEVTYRLAIPHLLRPPPAPDLTRFGPAALERSMRQITKMLEQSGAGTVEDMNAFLEANVNGRPVPENVAPPADPKEQAVELCYQAQGQRSRRGLQLLREALRLDPDCVDAYVQLAQRHSDPAAAEPLYRKAVEAGRRSLGEEPFNDPEYPFWRATESRPFMRAMSGLAEVLELQDRPGESADVLAQLLRLNPGDNQGVRYRYVPLLIKLGRVAEASALIEADDYRGDVSALFDFAAALIAFKQRRQDDADAMLSRAASRCPSAIPVLLHPDAAPPSGAPGWSPGDVTEGIMIADMIGDVWISDPAAATWLHEAWLKLEDAARKARRTPPRKKPRGTRRKPKQ